MGQGPLAPASDCPSRYFHSNMDSKRQQKFSRLIQKDLGEIFQQQAHALFGGAFITVTHVQVSPDLSLAKVYLSFLLVADKQGMMEQVQEHNKALRQLLANRIRHQARIIPQLNFYLDDTQEVAENIDKLFDGLHIPPQAEEDDDTYRL